MQQWSVLLKFEYEGKFASITDNTFVFELKEYCRAPEYWQFLRYKVKEHWAFAYNTLMYNQKKSWI